MPARADIYEPSEKDRKAGIAGQLTLDGVPFPYYTIEAPSIEEPVKGRGSFKYVHIIVPVNEVRYHAVPMMFDRSGKVANFAVADLFADPDPQPPREAITKEWFHKLKELQK